MTTIDEAIKTHREFCQMLNLSVKPWAKLNKLGSLLLEVAKIIERLTADLKEHGGHTDDCVLTGVIVPADNKCTCGWSEIEKTLKKKGGQNG